jgi:hypothetical protein
MTIFSLFDLALKALPIVSKGLWGLSLGELGLLAWGRWTLQLCICRVAR